MTGTHFRPSWSLGKGNYCDTNGGRSVGEEEMERVTCTKCQKRLKRAWKTFGVVPLTNGWWSK